jgi:hypothetical protein
MATVTIQLDEGQERKLHALAAASKRSEQDLCREAVEEYLGKQDNVASNGAPDAQAALRKMIGLVPDGPMDASARHDVRPEDPV